MLQRKGRAYLEFCSVSGFQAEQQILCWNLATGRSKEMRFYFCCVFDCLPCSALPGCLLQTLVLGALALQRCRLWLPSCVRAATDPASCLCEGGSGAMRRRLQHCQAGTRGLGCGVALPWAEADFQELQTKAVSSCLWQNTLRSGT